MTQKLSCIRFDTKMDFRLPMVQQYLKNYIILWARTTLLKEKYTYSLSSRDLDERIDTSCKKVTLINTNALMTSSHRKHAVLIIQMK